MPRPAALLIASAVAVPAVLLATTALHSEPASPENIVLIPHRDQPVEVGQVAWGRNFDGALKASETSGKPVLVLFQEVPGCSGCQDFGKEVLSHPLIVEAIESAFEPVLVFNNRSSGQDPELLKRYNEPSWNYQVMRFLKPDGEDLIPRRDRIWTVPAVAERLIEALEAADRPVPAYLQTVRASENTTGLAEVAFSQYCFWTGEHKLGQLDGVVHTEAGFFDGHEVTRVVYDPSVLPLKTLADHAVKSDVADRIYTTDGVNPTALPAGRLTEAYRAAPASDQKRQLIRQPQWRNVPALNAMQLTKINAFAPRGADAALQWLSPRQRAVLDQ